jgi:hypothetical protein
MEIFAIIATKVVTNVGIESYTSGLQKWNGAEDILNKNPTDIIINEYCIEFQKIIFPSIILLVYIASYIFFIIYIFSKLVLPVFIYNKL